MSEIIIISDSSCDLPESLIKAYNIHLIPFYVSFDGSNYYKEIVDLSIEDFYAKLRKDKIYPKTSLPSINDYYEAFKSYVENGKKVICVTLSSHFSGSYNSAVNARELILENYPNCEIEIINSLNATGGQGVLVLELARMIQDGIDYDRIIKTSKSLIEQARIFFFVETLDYLQHGGRIGKATALIGSMLNVKPIIHLQDGELFPSGKVRGSKKALSKVIELTKDYVGDHANDYHYLIAHADNINYATQLREQLQTALQIDTLEAFIFVGTTIGVYTGPDVAGVCLIKKYETLLDT